jgi:uncharacterized protein
LSRWLDFVARRPGWVILAAVAATLVSLAGLVDLRTGEPRLTVDPSADQLLPSSGPDRELYERMRKLFGTDEAIVIALGADDIFSSDALDRIARITHRLEAIDGVNHVLSISSALNVHTLEGELIVAPFYETVPTAPRELEQLRRDVNDNPIYGGSLVSRDARSAAILVYLDRMPDRELIERGLTQQVQQVLDEEDPDGQVWISGTPWFKVAASQIILSELGWMLPAILAILAVLLYAEMRALRAVLIPLLTISIALIWTLGTLGWLHQSLNLVTTLIPPLVLVVGFTYSLHVLAEYYAALREHEQRPTPLEAVREVLGSLTVPVLATGVTTLAGFLALAVSPLVAIRQFGLFSLLGVTYAMIASLTFSPACLALLPVPTRLRESRLLAFLDPMADYLASLAVRHRRRFVIAGVVVLAISAIGATRIRVATEFTTSFREGNRVLRDYRAINDRLGGANEMKVLIDSDVTDAFLIPANLRELQKLQEWLAAQPEIGATSSIVDYIELLNRAIHDDDPAYLKLPDSQREAGQLLFFGASPETSRFVDARNQLAAVLVRARVGDSESISKLAKRIEKRLDELPPHLRGSVTGSGVLLSKSIDAVARGQGSGLVLAYALIYAILAITFTSFRVGLVALFPNLLPIAVYFGALGFSGVTLNPSTSLIGSMALGIAVDDTIHYFTRFSQEARQRADERAATVATLRALIRPATFTSVGLCLGFLVLTLSELRTQAEFGMLAAFTLAVAWLADVTITPALCSGLRLVTLWDVVSLDLGEHPELAIPLFRGLRPRQARVFALMADIRDVKAGERLMTKGEEDRNIFVVVDGALVTWIEREGRRIELGKMGRGDTIGEVGYFGGTRTAHVEAATDGRLIRFDPDDLENLRRRYPRIAAVVFRNLNFIQAERLARTTDRVR